MQGLSVLGEDDVRFARQLCQHRETVPARTALMSQGEQPEHAWIVLSGLACRFKLLPEGERQIFAFLVPGDLCDLHVAMLGRMDHTIETNTASDVARISTGDVHEIVEHRPALARALLKANLIDLAVLREWIVNNGRREAPARVAHLLWELYLRHAAVGMTAEHRFRLPITQRDLADATSLSHVHISRTLTKLKEQRVIEWSRKTVRILDPRALRMIAGFEPDYLHASDAPSPEGAQRSAG